MPRLHSESSRPYTPQGGTELSPGRSVRLAVAPCESALCGNMQGDRAEVSPASAGIIVGAGSRHWRYVDWKRAVTHKVENITEVSSH